MRRRLAATAVAGDLVAWFLYCALEPHNFWAGGSDQRRTLFGWRAPGLSAGADAPPDRIWIVLAGWALTSLALGWYQPRHSLLIGTFVVLPTWLIYWPTAPRDLDGLWGVGLLVLPFAIPVYALAARLGGSLRGAVRKVGCASV